MQDLTLSQGFGLQVNNAGDAVGSFFGPINENINRQVAFRFVSDVARAKLEFEKTLAPGETREVLLVVDTVSKQVLGIEEGAILTAEGSSIVGITIRVSGRDPDVPILIPPGTQLPGTGRFCELQSEP